MSLMLDDYNRDYSDPEIQLIMRTEMQRSSNFLRNHKIIALKRAIVSTFDDSRWRELGYLTDTTGMIEGHERLLRSLYFGDDDYEGNVLRMVRQIADDNEDNIRIMEDFVELEAWLKNEDKELWAKIYGHTGAIDLNEVEEAAVQLDITELNKHAARIRNGIRNDPEQAIGSAKELLETVLKAIVGIEGERAKQEVTTLVKDAFSTLKLDADKSLDGKPGRATVLRTLSNLAQIVQGVTEVRNLYGTGHGRYKSAELDVAHARLVVNASITLATYLLEVSNYSVPTESDEAQENGYELLNLPW